MNNMCMSEAAYFSEYLRKNFPTNNLSGIRRSLVRGVGLNDADYIIKHKTKGRQLDCPAYHAWRLMLCRAHNEKFHAKHETYKDVLVCDEWLIFSNFRKWFIYNHVDGYQLDKDLLSEKSVKIYSPETCIYVPAWINTFITDSKASRGKYKIGTYWRKDKNKFAAECRHPMKHGGKFIGYFDSEDDAYEAWLNRKLEIAFELKPEMDKIDIRIYQCVINIIRNLV